MPRPQQTQKRPAQHSWDAASFPAASLFTEPFISFHLIKTIPNKPGILAEAACILPAVTEDHLLPVPKAVSLARL